MSRRQVTVFVEPNRYTEITRDWSKRKWELLEFPRYRRRRTDLFLPVSEFASLSEYIRVRRILSTGVDHIERRYPTFLRITCRVYEGAKSTTLACSHVFFIRFAEPASAMWFKLRYG